MVLQVDNDTLMVIGLGVVFLWGGVSGMRGRKMHGLRDINITSSDEVTGGEAFGARIAGGLVSVFGLVLTYMGVHSLVPDALLNGAFAVGTLWLGLVTLHDWDVPGVRGFVQTTGDGSNVAESARLGARIAGVLITSLGVWFLWLTVSTLLS